MSETQDEILEDVVNSEYKYGFVTDIETDNAPIGLTEETVRFISAKKEEPEWNFKLFLNLRILYFLNLK